MTAHTPIAPAPILSARTIRTAGLAVLLSAVSTVAVLAQGVPYGSPKEDFIAALADMEPVELVLQSVTSPGDNSSRVQERYAEAVTEWSGGKIVPRIVYGSAIQRGNTAPAIADGRITFGGVIAQYDPSNMPISAALVDLTFLSDPRPFAGILHSYGMMMEAGNAVPEAWEEQRDFGVEPGFIVSGASPSGFFCREPRSSAADFAGVQTRTGGVLHAQQVEAIGAANVSLPYSEMFEGLQRGIIDCALTSIGTAVVAGIIPVAPNFTSSTSQSFALTATNVGFDQVFWEELPLAARQLLYDLQTVYIEETIRSSLVSIEDGLAQFAESGGATLELADDATPLLAAKNAELLEKERSNAFFADGNAVIDSFLVASEKWDGIIEELGYYAMDPGYAGYAAWFDDATLDLKPFMDRLYQESMLPYRPE